MLHAPISPSLRARALLAACSVALLAMPACSPPAPPGPPPIFSDAGCEARYAQHTAAAGVHLPSGTAINWPTNPPSSGDHYGEWAVWGIHATPVPRGVYVHNEEHGGVVVLYRCTGDCTALRTQLEAVVNALPSEPMCSLRGPINRRVVLTEDPLIDTPVAAAAWGYTYHAQCVDASSLTAFILARTGFGPEDFCFEGSI